MSRRPSTSSLSASIASLAMLKVNWDQLGRDYLDSLAPFAIEAIKNSTSDVVSLLDTQQQIIVDFGLTVPLNVIRSLFKRLLKRGVLESSGGIYRRAKEILADERFEKTRKDVLISCSDVSQTLASFASDRYQQQWTVDDAEAALVAFLSQNTLELLFAAVDQVPFPTPKSSRQTDYIVSDFITHSQTHSPKSFAAIDTLLRGLLLTNALFLPDLGKVQQRFDKTQVLLDAPLLIFAVGAAGSARQAPVLELNALLRDNGASVCFFEHSLDESRGSLDACAHRIRNNLLRDAYGPSIEHFLETGMSPSDIDLLSARLPEKLKSLGMVMVPKPPYEPEFQVDEIGFERELSDTIHYSNPRALRRDIDSVSAVARARRGNDSTEIERSRAVFVTPNALLARTTREFFQSDSPPGAVALAITDHALASVLWLKNPTKAPDLPTKRLIADAYAALQPSDAIWKMYLAEISRLQEAGITTADEYYLLRHAQVAKQSLMELTHGETEAFSAGTVAEILAIAKETLTSDVRASLAKESQRTGMLEKRVTELQEYNVSVETRIERFAAGVARIVESTALWIVGGLLTLGTLLFFPWSLPDFSIARARYILVAAQLVLLFFTVVSLFVASSPLREAVQWIAIRVNVALVRLLKRLILPPAGDPDSVSERLASK